MRLLFLAVLIIRTLSLCTDIPANYTVQLPYDDYLHLDQTYDYIWHMGVLSAVNKTFGFLFGINSCRIKCTPDENYFNILYSLVGPGVRIVNTISWEQYQPDAFIRRLEHGYEISAGGLRFSTFYLNYYILSGQMGNVNITLDMSNQKSDVSLYGKIGQKIVSIHNIRPLVYMAGTLTFPNQNPIDVIGQGFIDHYWTNIKCSELHGQKWQWFFLQLSNDYQIQLIYSHSIGLKDLRLIHPNNTITHHNFKLESEYWTSERSGVKYPIYNTLIFEDIILYISPLIKDNEFYYSLRPLIYEGPSTIMGTFKGVRVAGTGTTEAYGFT